VTLTFDLLTPKSVHLCSKIQHSEKSGENTSLHAIDIAETKPMMDGHMHARKEHNASPPAVKSVNGIKTDISC